MAFPVKPKRPVWFSTRSDRGTREPASGTCPGRSSPPERRKSWAAGDHGHPTHITHRRRLEVLRPCVLEASITKVSTAVAKRNASPPDTFVSRGTTAPFTPMWLLTVDVAPPLHLSEGLPSRASVLEQEPALDQPGKRERPDSNRLQPEQWMNPVTHCVAQNKVEDRSQE
jgi:hypothetical protein